MSELIPEHIFPAMILSEDLGSPELNDLNKRFTAGTLKHSQYLEGLAQVVRKQERSLRTSQEKQKRKQSKRTSLLVVINESDAPLEVSDEIRAESQIEQTPTLESSQSIEELPALVEPSQPIEETPSVIEPIENTSNPLESYVEIPSADDNDTPPSTPERITDATDASAIAVELPAPINAEMGYSMGYDTYAPPMIISEINPPQEDQDLDDCKICWTNGASINLSCGHAYCQACLNELVRVACLNSAGNGIAVNCPDCGLKVTPDVLRTFLESEALRVFEYFEMKITADNLPQKPAACSSDGCVGLLIPDWLTSANKYQCKFCHVQHCADCFSADHPGMTCAAARRLNRPRSRTSRFFRQVRITAKAIPTYLATQLTMTLHPNAKRCPNCFNWIIKRGGCHHMSWYVFQILKFNFNFFLHPSNQFTHFFLLFLILFFF